MDTHTKQSSLYLGQISNNSDEKIGTIRERLISGNLVKGKDFIIKIVELGVGGGESLYKLTKSIGDRKDVKIFGVDIIPSLLETLRKNPACKRGAGSGHKITI